MRKLIESQLFRNFVSAIAFGIFYSIFSFIDKGYLEMSTIVTSTVFYFLFTCILSWIAPKLRKVLGYDRE